MKPARSPDDYAASVRSQYEDYPYPSRDPEKEGTFFACSEPQSLMALSHAAWGGKRDLRMDTRLLIAGCGTGDACIHYAEELLGCDAEIIAIDLSSKSIEIAKARLAKRGLSNVTFHQLSILDLPKAKLGQFDIIESSGVLHHLPDPDAGLAALTHMLKEDGLLTLMVYGQYGRYSVYLIQELMKQLLGEDMPRAKKIALTRDFLNHVPNGHWITVNNAMFLEDIQWPDGSGVYDLFLHSTDRAYTVPEIYDWLEGRGLQLVEFFSSFTDDSLYTPECYNSSPGLGEIFASKSPRARHQIAELMNGNMAKHYFHAAKQEKTQAVFADDMVIAYGAMQALFPQFTDNFLAALTNAPIGQRVEGNPRPFDGAPSLGLTKTTHVEALIPLIDGMRSIGQIVQQVVATSGARAEEVRRDLAHLYREYRSRQLVFLRHESIAPYRDGPAIMARVEQFLKQK
ncbi:MAG: class I SAM-dependent methyltransferase [Rickettsiales bacterium]|nr:class I SAM-dependent methyltransferase [Rickettsiales bacterium]